MKVEYHPLSGRADEYLSLYDYRQRRQKVRHRVEEEPWLPFSTRIDYEFSDIILDAGMNARQSNSLILLLHRVIKGEKFTLKNYAEIQKRWKEASSKLAKVAFDFIFCSLILLHFLIHSSSLRKKKSLCLSRKSSAHSRSTTVPYGIGLAIS